MIHKKKKTQLMNEKIVKIWEIFQGKLSAIQQRRVIDRVVHGMEFKKSIAREGIMFLAGGFDEDVAFKMFRDGTLGVIDNQSVDKGAIHVIRNDNTVFTHDKKKEEFVPRPK